MSVLDNTAECVPAVACETCQVAAGAPGTDSELYVCTVAVCTVGTSVGVACVTLCAGCCSSPADLGLRWSPGMAVRRVLVHCQHLGIDPDGIVRALVRPGRAPAVHRAALRQLRAGWPTLADALAQLVEEAGAGPPAELRGAR